MVHHHDGLPSPKSLTTPTICMADGGSSSGETPKEDERWRRRSGAGAAVPLAVVVLVPDSASDAWVVAVTPLADMFKLVNFTILTLNLICTLGVNNKSDTKMYHSKSQEQELYKF